MSKRPFDLSVFKVVNRHLQLILIAHISVRHHASALRVLSPDDLINAVHVLQKCRDALQPIGQLGADRTKIDPAALLEVSELRDLQPVEHYLPADAPCSQRWRFPVVFFKLNVVLAQVNANGLERFQIKLLHVLLRRLQDHLKLHVLIKTVGIVAVTPVSRAARRLHVSDLVRLGPEHSQKSFRSHGSRAHFNVIRLLQHASALCPEFLQAEDKFLVCRGCGVRHAKLLIYQIAPDQLRLCACRAALPSSKMAAGNACGNMWTCLSLLLILPRSYLCGDFWCFRLWWLEVWCF